MKSLWRETTNALSFCEIDVFQKKILSKGKIIPNGDQCQTEVKILLGRKLFKWNNCKIILVEFVILLGLLPKYN